MARQHLAGRHRPLLHGQLPAGPVGGQVDLAEYPVDHAVEQLALAGHVVIQGHRLDPENLPEPAHAERTDAMFVGKGDGRAQHLVAVQRSPTIGAGPRGSGRSGGSGHRQPVLGKS